MTLTDGGGHTGEQELVGFRDWGRRRFAPAICT